MTDFDDILNMEISEEAAEKLTETLVAWKDEYAARLEEKNEEVLNNKVQELEDLNEEWREKVAEEYSDRFCEALEEIRGEEKAHALAEVVKTDPSFRILEEIKKLVAPTINEEYVSNVYLEELQQLREENEAFKREKELREGAEILEELIEGYSDALKPLLRTLIGEGTADEVENKFYNIIDTITESSDEDEDDEEDDEDSDDEDDEDDKKKKKSKKSDDEDEDDEEDDEDEDTNEDFDWEEFSLDEDVDYGVNKKKPSLRDFI